MFRLVPAASLKVTPAPVFDGHHLARLVYEIAEKGVERPFLVNRELVVLCRGQEAGACRLLDLPEVPVYVLDVEALAQGGKIEHELRPAEAILVGRLIEEHVRPLAAKHSAEGRAKGQVARHGHEIERLEENERVVVRNRASAALRMSVTTYSRARDIVVAAEEDPEHYGDLPALMDTTTIAGTHRELRRRQKELNPPVELPPERKARGSLVKVTPGKGPIQMVQNTMYSLLAAADLLENLQPGELPEDMAESWIDDLAEVTRSLGRFRGRLIDLTKEQRNGQ